MFPDLSEEKLLVLLSVRAESDKLEFKETFDYSSKAKDARVRLVKDLIAMANTPCGGYIVLGVHDGDYEPVGLPLDYALDQAVLQDKIVGYMNVVARIHYRQHKIRHPTSQEPKPKVRLYGLIFVEQSDEPVIAAKDGVVQLPDGKQHKEFACGDILVRKGSQSIKATDDDISHLFDAVRKQDKERNWAEWKSQLTVVIEELKAQGTIAVGTADEVRSSAGDWHNLPRPDFEEFIGRASFTNEIIDSLTNSRAWIVSIDGVGGVGKTALALHCAYQCLEDRHFELIVWTSAKSTRLTLAGIDQIVPSLTSLDNLLDEIISISFPELLSAKKDEKLKEVKWILQNAKTLLIVDNLETVSDQTVFDFLRDLPTPSKALVTSRHRIGQGERVVRLDGFAPEEARRFLTYEARRSGATMVLRTSNDKQQKIVEVAGGIPLAIKWMIGQVALGRTVAEAIQRLSESGSPPLEFCFRETYQLLPSQAKQVMNSIPLFDGVISRDEFAAATNLQSQQLDDSLAELVRVSILNAIPSSTALPLYDVLPMTRYFSQSLSDRGEQSSMLKRLSTFYERNKSNQEVKRQAASLFAMVGASTEQGQAAALLTQVAFGNYQRGRYDEAVKLFEEAVKISPRLSFIYQTWATVEWQEGNYPRARELWKEAARLNPVNSLTWRSWGLMEKELQNHPKARECLKKAVEVNDGDRVAWHALGVELSRSGEFREAERCFLKSLHQTPKSAAERHHNVVTHHALAVALKKMKRVDEALKYVRLGLQLDPENARLLGLEAEILH